MCPLPRRGASRAIEIDPKARTLQRGDGHVARLPSEAYCFEVGGIGPGFQVARIAFAGATSVKPRRQRSSK